ncbi:MAG: dienelactone hydrolase family protein [Proteobacteria bacterium]|nr:dienelactone hydrolase family protein [Pseudomonadota bacterium]
MTAAAPARFRDRKVVLANGIEGETFAVPSASPANYFQAVSRPAEMPTITIDAKLFRPSEAATRGKRQLPAVIIAPGSLGVTAANLTHASTLTDLGIAAVVIDGFAARDVTSTVAKQTQFSFAASAYDVLAAWKVVAAMPGIDPFRIGTQGHSRGGAAVLTSATRCFADAVLGVGRGPCAVYGAYPWSGHQFLDPRVGATEIRAVIGDRDEWCSPMQVQGHCQAIRLSGGKATWRIFSGAHHSFDRGSPVIDIPEASVSPHAPTTYMADDGAFIHPLSEKPDPALLDRDVMVYSLKAGYGKRGAKLGSNPGDAELFRDDMIAFWTRCLG